MWRNGRLRFESSSKRTHLSLKIKLFIRTFSVLKDKINYNLVIIEANFPQKSKWALEPPSKFFVKSQNWP